MLKISVRSRLRCRHRHDVRKKRGIAVFSRLSNTTMALFASIFFISWTLLTFSMPLNSSHTVFVVRKSKYNYKTVQSLGPKVHVILACESTCCGESLSESLNGIFRQTIVPTDLTIIHFCLGKNQKILESTAHRIVVRNIGSLHRKSSNLLSMHKCRKESMIACLHGYLISSRPSMPSKNIGNGRLSFKNSTHHSFILSERVLLESTAIEKLFLSLSFRPRLLALRPQSFNLTSLEQALENSIPSLIRPNVPLHSMRSHPSLKLLPLYFTTSEYTSNLYSGPLSNGSHWNPILHLVNHSRLLREPLYTLAQLLEVDEHSPLSLGKIPLESLPPNLYNEMSYYRSTARLDRSDMFQEGESLGLPKIPTQLSFDTNEKSILLVLPGLNLNDLSKMIICLAEHAVKLGWGVTIVTTNSFWEEDDSKELTLNRKMYMDALHITSDIFDLPSLADHYQSTKLFVHVLHTRSPEYVLICDSQWAISRLPLIQSLLPNSILANLNNKLDKSELERKRMDLFDVRFSTNPNLSQPSKQANSVHLCLKGASQGYFSFPGAQQYFRRKGRDALHISKEAFVLLFYADRREDVRLSILVKIIEKTARDKLLNGKLRFIIIGDDAYSMLHNLPILNGGSQLAFVFKGIRSSQDLRSYLAISDALLSLAKNEELPLFVFDAMQAGKLILTRNVSEQSYVITNETAVLLPSEGGDNNLMRYILTTLKVALGDRKSFSKISLNGQRIVRKNFQLSKFPKCILHKLYVERKKEPSSSIQNTKQKYMAAMRLSGEMIDIEKDERVSGLQAMRSEKRSIEGLLTIVIKTYICDSDVQENAKILAQSIRLKYPLVRIILGNDGPLNFHRSQFVLRDTYITELELPPSSGISYGRNALSNYATTEYVFAVDDDQVFDITSDLWPVLDGLRYYGYDIVGVRIRNLPGIHEHENDGIVLPRYVGKINSLPGGNLSVCVWNENRGPGVYGLRDPIPVDVVHQAFVASTEILRQHPWRNELETNEHMPFFYDAKIAGVRVGYLPSVFINHLPRPRVHCYRKRRYRDANFRDLLPFREYDDPNRYTWDFQCSWDFPKIVQKHVDSFRKRKRTMTNSFYFW